jgi:hypothetical protein
MSGAPPGGGEVVHGREEGREGGAVKATGQGRRGAGREEGKEDGREGRRQKGFIFKTLASEGGGNETKS